MISYLTVSRVGGVVAIIVSGRGLSEQVLDLRTDSFVFLSVTGMTVSSTVFLRMSWHSVGKGLGTSSQDWIWRVAQGQQDQLVLVSDIVIL